MFACPQTDSPRAVDRRTPEEFAEGRCPGAINIPFMLKGSEGGQCSRSPSRTLASHQCCDHARSAAVYHSLTSECAYCPGLAPNEKFLDEVKAKFPNPADDKVAIGCQVGGRSAKAAQLLDQVRAAARIMPGTDPHCQVLAHAASTILWMH